MNKKRGILLIKLKVLSDKPEEEPVYIRLEELGGDVILSASKDNQIGSAVLVLKKDGMIALCGGVSKDLGFKCDNFGQVAIAI